MQDQRIQQPARFHIRWDNSWGGYRVNIPNFSSADVVRLDALRAKLDEMELHDDLPDSFDMGYMAAWQEFKAFLDAP